MRPASEIRELHVGLKGTMNALFLKGGVAKTHRGLRGGVETGKSGWGGRPWGSSACDSLKVSTTATRCAAPSAPRRLYAFRDIAQFRFAVSRRLGGRN